MLYIMQMYYLLSVTVEHSCDSHVKYNDIIDSKILGQFVQRFIVFFIDKMLTCQIWYVFIFSLCIFEIGDNNKINTKLGNADRLISVTWSLSQDF